MTRTRSPSPLADDGLPRRYELRARLGQGGGGDVWAAFDVLSGHEVAVKLVRPGAPVEEHDALIREATVLLQISGGTQPTDLRLGRLRDGRPYLVRTLARGESLAALVEKEPKDGLRAVRAVLAVAGHLAELHRADLLHGDIKPANIIVGQAGDATLVDLGLSTRLTGRGGSPNGMTVAYAAPEVLEGGPLTLRSEVFSIGKTLEAALRGAEGSWVPALRSIALRATDRAAEARYPSVDEFRSAMQHALRDEGAVTSRSAWRLHDMADMVARLSSRLEAGAPGIVVIGPNGSGRSTALAELAFELGAKGRRVAFVSTVGPIADAVALEVGPEVGEGWIVVVDDADRLSEAELAAIDEARSRGARLVIASHGPLELAGPTLETFAIPPLSSAAADALIHAAAPSLASPMRRQIAERVGGRPGPLREVLRRIQDRPIVSERDLDDLALETSGDAATSSLVEIRDRLERGHLDDAAALLDAFDGPWTVELSVLRARLYSHQGAWKRASEELDAAREASRGAPVEIRAAYGVEDARATLRAGDNAGSAEIARAHLATLTDQHLRAVRLARVETLSIGGLALGYIGKQDEAVGWLRQATEEAEESKEPRLLSIAFASLAFILQRGGDLAGAEAAYESALAEAEAIGDAGTVATTRLNLATVAKAKSDPAKAIVHLEAAVDMGRRSGRHSTERHALLNLANLDLYLGRVEKAGVSIEALARRRDELAPQMKAQLTALEAEFAQKSGRYAEAERLCERCKDAYLLLARPIDAAEAAIEGVFAALQIGAEVRPKLAELRARLQEAEGWLGESEAHRGARLLALGALGELEGDSPGARDLYDQAIAASQKAGKQEWLARAFLARSELHVREGQMLLGRRDRDEALLIAEGIASKLPRDLREVFWNDPSRRALRAESAPSAHRAPTGLGGASTLANSSLLTPSVVWGRERPGALALPEKLARVLELTREIAGTYDLEELLGRVTEHAVRLFGAERGFVLLRSRRPERGAELSIHATAAASAEGDAHAQFSQSIAERVVATSEPIITMSAKDDARMAGYVSVHKLMLEAVACVPIRLRGTETIGAIYLETRLAGGLLLDDDVALLSAMADQVAIAIHTARLISENETRAKELELKNQELAEAQGRLEELLGHRTAQLQATRRDLRSARAVLRSHFGYEGLVGTSEAMRKVYALIDRVKETDVAVLITGESGTGKEIVARAIHHASSRAKEPFLGLNCGAIPEHLLESELFGHVRGAFTGAERDRKGLFREASKGTLLLDEIGEMPQKMQAGLLRVLQEKVVRPVGGNREEPVDTRVIAATHRSLEAMVEEGRFREDLFYRLNVIQVRVPPLRERIDDIPPLIDHFLGIFAARYGRERRSVSRAALKLLMAHPWPGNVRQLEHALLNAWVLSDGAELLAEDFDLGRAVPSIAAPPSVTASAGGPPSSGGTSLETHKASERDRMVQALTASNWNRVKAAELIGMPRRTFYRRLKDYGIQ